MLPYLLLAFCAQEAPPAIPDPHAVGRGNPALDVLHYELRLRLAPRRRFVEGTTTLEFKLLQNVSTLELDFHHMLGEYSSMTYTESSCWTSAKGLDPSTFASYHRSDAIR